MAKNAKHKGNGYDLSVVSEIVGRHEELDAECESIMGKARRECQSRRADQKELLQDAEDAHGIPKKVLRAELRIRKQERKLQKTKDEIDDEIVDDVLNLHDQLGEYASTPLGAAAVKKAEASEAATQEAA
ncbi:MAG: hypothetical protein GC208_09585 [Alphaproteobacteria bacterium]|nr:hypothetical protein [Alphaproteobacteria bacterium]